MRASRVVNRTRYCWQRSNVSSAPETTKAAMVRPSSQAHVAPANVKAMAKHTTAPVPTMEPTQSMARSVAMMERSVAPGGLIRGR